MKKLIEVLIFRKIYLALLLLMITISTHAATFNVSTTSELIDALFNVSPGDEIVLAPGTYENDNVMISGSSAYFYAAADGTSSNPITIRSSSSSNKAHMKGDDIGSLTVLRVVGDYWIVKDLKISTGQKGLVFDNSNHSQAINCEVWDTGNEAVHVRDGSDYVVLDGLKVYNTGNVNPGFGEGIYIGSDKGSWDKYDPYVWYTEIRNCDIGPDVRAEAFDIKEGTKETIVEYCLIDGSGISGSNFADSFIDLKGTRTYVRYNTFNRNNEGNITKGIATIDRGVEMSSYEHVVHDNIFNMNSTSGNIFEAYSGTDETYAWDNTRNPAGDMYNSSRIQTSCCPSWYNGGNTIRYNLTTSANNGSVDPAGGEFAENSQVTVTAVPENGYKFSYWSGAISGNKNPVIITMDSDKSITAHFEVAPTYNLTVNNGNGSGAYTEGTVINISANTPPSGKQFSAWTGDISHLEDAGSAITSVFMPEGNITVSATYTDIPESPLQKLDVIDDAYVREDKPDRNYGSRTSIRTEDVNGEDQVIYLKFDLSQVDASKVNVAKLRLYPYSGSGVTNNLLNVSNNNWNENNLTWNNRPNTGSQVASWLIDDDDKYFFIDITNEVKNKSGGLLSFAITTSGSANDIRYRSYESGTDYPIIQFNENANSSARESLFTEIPSSENMEKFSLYPNPNRSGELNIIGNLVQSVIIIDLYGKPVLNSSKNKIDIQSLTPGLYLVKIGDYTQKLIVR